MSTYPAAPPRTAASNSMGVAGFVISLIGLISCGILSPVGAILSWIGMRRQPDGLAIAGLVMGLIGSAWLIIAMVFGLFTLVLAALGIAAAASQQGP